MKERKTAYIIIRLKPSEKETLKIAGGKENPRKFSEFIRSKLGLT